MKELPVLQPPACCTPMVREPLTEDDARSLAGVFKALSDPVRLRLLSLIASFEGGEACVCDLTGPFEVSQPTISHHLRVLREAGLIDCERRGTWVYYWVLPDALGRLGSLLATDGIAGGHTMTRDLARRALAEALGTGLLVTVVVGSGIMATRLSPGQVGLQLLENSTATALGLAVLILVLGPVSGAHFNPVVTLVDHVLGRRDDGGTSSRVVLAYIPAQIAGGIGGAVLANLMFALPAATASTHARTGGHLWLGEVVATAGLILLIFALARTGRGVDRPRRGRRVHRCRVLVHLVHQLRQSGRDHRPRVHGHLRRDRALLGRPDSSSRRWSARESVF